MSKIVGIDLGTTYSAIAALDDRGQPVTLPNRDGDMLTPSAVLLMDGSAVVGQPALDVQQETPDQVATLIKRRMGMPDMGRLVAGRKCRPETLSAILLRKLANDAELRLGGIEGVVITVPAYFDDTRRKATQDAGRIAGLSVLDVLDEPTAAALAYSAQQGKERGNQTVLVYDLGGGTFDVTVVKLTPKRFQVLAIEGDVRLGGKDWDDRLVNHVAEKFRKQFGDDPRLDDQAETQLHTSAERAKRTLSKLEQASITCSHAGNKISVAVTRKEFEALTKDLLTRTRLTAMQAIKQAGLGWDQIDRVLMVGGSTHMPMTGEMLEKLAGKAPDSTLAVSEVVARGAAIHAGILTAKSRKSSELLNTEVSSLLEDVVEISVNAHSMGIEVKARTKDDPEQKERINDILIPKNSQLPASATRIYRTGKQGQSRVRVRVLQGEAHQAEACIPLGECWITGLSKRLPKKSPIQVRCTVQANGIVEVAALDLTNGKMAQASLQRTGGLTEEEIVSEAAWVKGLKIQ